MRCYYVEVRRPGSTMCELIRANGARDARKVAESIRRGPLPGHDHQHQAPLTPQSPRASAACAPAEATRITRHTRRRGRGVTN